MDGMLQPILPLPRTHGTPDHRMLARAAALRGDASETAECINNLLPWERAKLDRLLREHEALSLRAIAAREMAHGRLTLARHYLRSARRVEAGL